MGHGEGEIQGWRSLARESGAADLEGTKNEHSLGGSQAASWPKDRCNFNDHCFIMGNFSSFVYLDLSAGFIQPPSAVCISRPFHPHDLILNER